MVGERWCVKDGVCDTVVCERWCVKMVCGEVPHGQPQCHKCHACHANERSMSPNATPATQMEGQAPRLPRKWHQVPCWPRKVAQRPGRPSAPKARHQSQPSATSATPATQMEGQCHQVPRLPRKWKVNVTSATPATQMEGQCHQAPRAPRKVARRPAQCHKCHANGRSMSRKMVCDKVVCERWCVTKRCVKDGV